MIIFNLGRKGGLPLYAKYIVENMDDDNLKVVQSKYTQKKITKSDVDIYNIPTYRSKIEFILYSPFSLFYIFLFLLFQKIRFKEEIVYFPYVHYWSYVILLFCKMLKFKSYLTVHDAVPHFGDGLPLEAKVLSGSIRLCDHLIALSEYVKLQIGEYYPECKKSIFLSSLGTMAQDHSIDFEFKKTIEDDGFLFFGRVSKYKGVELMLEAFASSEILKNKKITVAGKSNYDIDYKPFIEKLPNLTIIDDFISEYEIRDFFNLNNILVLPYIEATQSGVITYAMKSNTLIAMTDVGGLKEQLAENTYFMCEPDVPSIQGMLENVVVNKEKRDSVYFKFIEANKDMEKTNKKIVKNLENFLFFN